MELEVIQRECYKIKFYTQCQMTHLSKVTFEVIDHTSMAALPSGTLGSAACRLVFTLEVGRAMILCCRWNLSNSLSLTSRLEQSALEK